MRLSKTSLLLLLSTLIIIGACRGKKGDPGPTGPVGPQGPQGVQGPIGTANVIYSSWFTPTAWTIPGLSSSSASFDRNAPGITATVISQGTVLAYVQLSGDGGATRSLPATVNISPSIIYQLNYLIPGAGTLRFTTNDLQGSFTPATTNQFRYVIIPGGVSGGRFTSGPAAGYSVSQLQSMNYQQVKEMFGIPDDGSNEK